MRNSGEVCRSQASPMLGWKGSCPGAAAAAPPAPGPPSAAAAWAARAVNRSGVLDCSAGADWNSADRVQRGD